MAVYCRKVVLKTSFNLLNFFSLLWDFKNNVCSVSNDNNFDEKETWERSLYIMESLSYKQFNNSYWKVFIIFGFLQLKLMNQKFDVRWTIILSLEYSKHCFNVHKNYLSQTLKYSAFKLSSFELLSRSVSRNGDLLVILKEFFIDNYEFSIYPIVS